MITKRLKILSDLQAEMNKIKELIEETLENDKVYQELQEQLQKVREEAKEKKVKITSNDTLQKLEDDMKNLKKEIKDNKDVLAQELADYYRESGSMEIEDEEGNRKRIIFSVKLTNS